MIRSVRKFGDDSENDYSEILQNLPTVQQESRPNTAYSVTNQGMNFLSGNQSIYGIAADTEELPTKPSDLCLVKEKISTRTGGRGGPIYKLDELKAIAKNVLTGKSYSGASKATIVQDLQKLIQETCDGT